MYPNSIYTGLKVVPMLGTLGPKYIQFGYMDTGIQRKVTGSHSACSSSAQVMGQVYDFDWHQL